jgi:hypothetical protein
MKNKVQSEKQLVAEFFSNIGVAWFSASVIGVFVGQKKNFSEILFSTVFGLIFSILFLFFGVKLISKKI